MPTDRRIISRIDDLEHLIGLGFLVTIDRLNHIEQILHQLTQQEEHEMADLTRLTEEVSQNTDAVASASALLGQLSQLIRDAADDPAELNALADTLDANTQALADAVTANTPAAPGGGGETPEPPA